MKVLLVSFLFCVATLSPIHAQEVLPPPDDTPEPPAELSLVVPAGRRVPTCSSAGTVVDYPAPRLVTPCTNETTITCEPPSGSLFPVGDTVVTCTAINDCGDRTNLTFTITVVVDTAAPSIVCPTNIIAYSTGTNGAVVDYELPRVSDDADASPSISCEPPPGTLCPVGSTAVTCTAIDACGRTAQCTFVVEVRPAELRIRPAIVPGGPKGGVPGVVINPVGFEGLDVASAIDGDWEPLGGTEFADDIRVTPSRFYRPPVMEGVKRAPQGEVAYVAVGLLRAYSEEGVNPARGLTDSSTSFGTKLLAGDAGGSGNNRWSGEQNMPFTFHFFGRPYSKFRVSKNGLLTFSTNIVTGTEGLSYFNFAQSGITNVMTNALPLWNNGFAIDNTIFCMAGRHVTQTAADDVYGFLHGSSPRRQVWIVFRHNKDFYGRTITAIVLEETSNRILLMDMDTDVPNIATNRLIAGIQGELFNAREVRQVPATPAVRLMAGNGSLADNGCYLFRPYTLGGPVSGSAAPEIMSATNLDRFITEQMRVRNAPGLTVAVSRNGRLVFNKAYGYANVEKSEPMKPHHRACIGSVSKELAAIGVEKLVQLGAIPSLNSWAYAPNRLGKSWFWAGVQEGVTNNIHTTFGAFNLMTNLTNVTIRHLLSHTAAFANINDDPGATRAYANSNYTQLTPQDQVRWFMATQPLITNAVQRVSRYSNPSFKQVGVLIEEVAGQNFESWMMANVMIPGGAPFARLMRTYENEETWRDARRYLHYSSRSPWGNSRISGDFGPVTYGDAIYANAADGAAGSWTATAADLVRLMAAVDGLPNRTDILNATRIAEMDARAFPAMSGDQGVGWDNVSISSSFVEKNGNIGYGSSHLRRSTTPDRLTVAVVCNSGAGVDNISAGVFNAIRALPPVNPNYDLFGPQIQF